MTSPRDELRRIEAGYSPATDMPTAERDELRRMEAAAYNPPAQSKLVTWGAVALLLLLVFSSNQPKR